MQKFLGNNHDEAERRTKSRGVLVSRIFGFIGSAVILWIGLRALAPVLAAAWGISWIVDTRIRVGIVLVASAICAVVLSRIEGTIWARYYVIIGYLLCLIMVVWIVLRLLNFV